VPQLSTAFDLLVTDTWSHRELADKCAEVGELPVGAGAITLERAYVFAGNIITCLSKLHPHCARMMLLSSSGEWMN